MAVPFMRQCESCGTTMVMGGGIRTKDGRRLCVPCHDEERLGRRVENASSEVSDAEEPATVLPSNDSAHASAVKRRYADAYSVAGFLTIVGNVVKVCAVVLALVIVFGMSEVIGGRSGAASLVIAIPVGFVLFVLGVLIGAQGAMIQASLDSAVNSSPFLSDEDKAAVMKV